jgi:predicted nucleic acid-binding protein
MSSLVLDASVATRLILSHPKILPTWLEALEDSEVVLVPQHYFSEVGNALWKYVRLGELTEAVALERLREARDLVSESIPDEDLIEEALSTAVRFEHPVYDALYAVLARRHGYPVATADKRLKKLLEALRVDWI